MPVLTSVVVGGAGEDERLFDTEAVGLQECDLLLLVVHEVGRTAQGIEVVLEEGILGETAGLLRHHRIGHHPTLRLRTHAS